MAGSGLLTDYISSGVIADRPATPPALFPDAAAFWWATDTTTLSVWDGATWTDVAGGSGMTNPMTTAGDIIIGGVAGAPARLGISTNGFVLTAVAGVPAWAAAGGGVSLSTVNEFTATQYVAPVALTDGANIAVDAELSNNFTVTLGGNRTLDNPTNLEPGMVLNFEITQDGTGSRTLAYGSAYNWPGGTSPTLSTAAGAVDVISAISFNGTTLQCVSQLAFS